MDREIGMIHALIKEHNLDLSGMNVLCECASGPYAFTPLIIHLAGGKSYNLGKDTQYGLFSNNKKQILEIFHKAGINEMPEFFRNEFPLLVLENADIIPNVGLLRPISTSMINHFKNTAVVPLMWETWEFRDDDIDIQSCISKRIPVIGTNEGSVINMFGYNGFIGFKLLFNLGLECYNNQVVLLGTGITASSINELFTKSGVQVTWFSDEKTPGSNRYDQLGQILDYDSIDAIIVAEHHLNKELIGSNGYISFQNLYKKFPELKIGHICGSIDAGELEASGLSYYPEEIMPFGYMSYQAFHLGPRAVIELNVLGLKVGEIVGKARKRGASVEESISLAVASGYGQDFPGGFLNFTK